MLHPIMRVTVMVSAVIVVVAVLKLFGLAPDDVFTPLRNGDSVDMRTPRGAIHLSDDSRSLFRPLLLTHILSVPALRQLCRRLGYSGWFSLAMLVPLANILLLYFLAFAAWPLGQHQAGSPSALGTRKEDIVDLRGNQFAASGRPLE